VKRVFFALLLGGELGEDLLEATRVALGGATAARRGFRLPRAAGLHLTLLFLGDVEEERLAPLWEAVRTACAGAPRPRLVVAGAGAFPKRGRERVLWLGVEEERPGRLDSLWRGVLAGAGRAGFDTAADAARPFRPHITVARPRRTPARVPAPFYALSPRRPWTPGELSLVESRRAATGPPEYVPLERLALGE